MMLGGRIAEKIFFDKVSTGAADDLQKVTRLAYPSNNQDGSLQHSRPYSEQTAELVDEEVRAIANAAYERTRALLTEKKELMAAVAKLLLEKEVIHKADVEAILGKRPFDPGMLGNGRGDGALDVQPAMMVQDAAAPPGA